MEPAALAPTDAPLGASFALRSRKQIPQAIVSVITSHPGYTNNPLANASFEWAPKGTYAFYKETNDVYWLAVKTSPHKDAIARYRLELNETGTILVNPGLEENAHISNFPSFEALLTKLNELGLLGIYFNEYTAQIEQQQQIQALAQRAFAQEKARLASYGWYSETLSKKDCRSLVDSSDAKSSRPFVFCPSSHKKAITLVFQGSAYRCKFHKEQWKVTHGAPARLTFPTLDKLLEHYKLDPRYRGLPLS